MLQSMGSQTVGHSLVPEQQQQHAESQKNDTNLQNKNRVTDVKNKCTWLPKGEGVREG